MDNRRALCLNVTYEPLGFLTQNRAVTVVLQEKAEVLEQSKRLIRSQNGTKLYQPTVIRLRRHVRPPRSLKECISARVLFARDHFTCQYCGKKEKDLKGKNNKLTIDHIKPRAQGGRHHWENVVAACYICNIKKRDRTPMQANMKFVHLYKNRSPKKPHLLVFTWGGKVSEEQAKWIKMFYGVGSLDEDVEWVE